MTKASGILIVFLLCMAWTAQAQSWTADNSYDSDYEDYSEDRTGQWRIIGSGSLSLIQTDIDGGGSFDVTTYSGSASVGYFLTGSSELGVDFTFFGFDFDSGTATANQTNIAVRYAYHLAPLDTVDPYLGARLGVGIVDVEILGVSDSESALMYGAFVGM